jgi:hypothetical protein
MGYLVVAEPVEARQDTSEEQRKIEVRRCRRKLLGDAAQQIQGHEKRVRGEPLAPFIRGLLEFAKENSKFCGSSQDSL